MRRLAITLVFVLSGVPRAYGQIWTAPPEPPGVYRVYGPGGRSWVKESWPLYDCEVDPAQQVRITTISSWTGFGEKAWITGANYLGGNDTYGQCGRMWTSRPIGVGALGGYSPDGRTWTSWQTASDTRVTYEAGGRTWVTGSSSSGGTTTYGPGGQTWISEPLAIAQGAATSIADVPRNDLPTPEYPMPVPRR